jgi:hypothetical protein
MGPWTNKKGKKTFFVLFFYDGVGVQKREE